LEILGVQNWLTSNSRNSGSKSSQNWKIFSKHRLSIS